MGKEVTKEQAQAVLGKAAVLYAFDRGASVKALASVYHMTDTEVEGIIRRAMANLVEQRAAASELLEAGQHILAILDHPTRSVTALDADKLRAAINKALNNS